MKFLIFTAENNFHILHGHVFVIWTLGNNLTVIRLNTVFLDLMYSYILLCHNYTKISEDCGLNVFSIEVLLLYFITKTSPCDTQMFLKL